MNAQIIMNCPACSAPVEPEDDLEVGEAVECDQCEAILVVTSVEPLEFEIEEDDIDEDDDEDLDEEDEYDDSVDDQDEEEEDDEEED
jgi:alpha-aminoadipate/glutamate carrier protein LysW